MSFSLNLWIMAILYILAGINHFIMPGFYEKIIPPFFGNKKLINWASGIAEIALGIFLLIPTYSTYAAWGIIALLIAVFPANIYHFMLGRKKQRAIWMLALRLPLQFVLIGWAYTFT